MELDLHSIFNLPAPLYFQTQREIDTEVNQESFPYFNYSEFAIGKHVKKKIYTFFPVSLSMIEMVVSVVVQDESAT